MNKKGKILNREYEALMDKHLEENIASPINADVVSYAFNIVFCSISSDFAEHLEVTNPKAINDAFWNAVYENRDVLMESDFSFIKYIHIFNYADEHDIGFVELYLDFLEGRLTDDRDYVGRDNGIFDSDSLVKFFGNIGFSGSDFIELCNDENCAIYNPLVYSTVLSKQENGKNSYQFGEFFSSHFIWDQKDGKDDTELQGLMEQWLDNFEAKKGDRDSSVTNVFFVRGESGNHKLFGENEQYVLYANVGIDGSKVNKACIKAFLQQFKEFIDRISLNIIVCIKEYQKRQNAVRTSIAQVMARNLAHNYGAHVISNLVNDGVYAKLSDEEIKESLTKFASSNNVFQKGKNLQLPYLFQYLKSRMDYLSEVTFGIPNMLSTKYVYGDVCKELDRVRILLNYISGIPGFRYNFCLKHNGKVLTDENDIAIAFPSDVLGNQAFYNIIENIIRNTAKHACNNNQEVVTFTIEFTDVEDFPDFYCVEIDNGLAEADIDELVKKQNWRINTSVLENDNNLRSHSLGLLEMEASAAFLRQVDIAKVDSFDYHFEDKDGPKNEFENLILLKAINKNGALGYRFFMQKPKEFLLVGDFDVTVPKKDAAGKEGVQFISEEEFAKALSEGKSFAHPFLLYHYNISEQTKELLSDGSDCKTLLPVRKLRLGKEDEKSITKIINTSKRNEIVRQMKEHVWISYYENVIVKELKNPNNKETIIVTEFDGFSSPINNQVVFLNHATKTQHEEYWQLFRKDPSFEGWIENLSSRTSTKLPEFSKYSIGTDNEVSEYVLNIEEVKPLNYEIFEAYHNKVLVLDERVQKFSKENFEGSSNKVGGQIPSSSLFESTHVLMPEIQLDPVVYKEEAIKKIEQFINDNMANAFVLIHYGILERMYKKETVINEKLCAWAKVAKRLVVTSGRGAHSLTLPTSVCFVNLSSVLYAFAENRNKFIINNLLNQTRRKNG